MRTILYILFVVGFCSCSSAYLVTRTPQAFDELDNELHMKNVDVLLSNGKEIFGYYERLTNEKLYISYSKNGPIESLPINDVKKVTIKNHALGAIEGIGWGCLAGFIGGLFVHGLQGSPSGSYAGILPFFVMISGPAIGIAAGAIQGHKYEYIIN